MCSNQYFVFCRVVTQRVVWEAERCTWPGNYISTMGSLLSRQEYHPPSEVSGWGSQWESFLGNGHLDELYQAITAHDSQALDILSSLGGMGLNTLIEVKIRPIVALKRIAHNGNRTTSIVLFICKVFSRVAYLWQFINPVSSAVYRMNNVIMVIAYMKDFFFFSPLNLRKARFSGQYLHHVIEKSLPQHLCMHVPWVVFSLLK